MRGCQFNPGVGQIRREFNPSFCPPHMAVAYRLAHLCRGSQAGPTCCGIPTLISLEALFVGFMGKYCHCEGALRPAQGKLRARCTQRRSNLLVKAWPRLRLSLTRGCALRALAMAGRILANFKWLREIGVTLPLVSVFGFCGRLSCDKVERT